MSDTITSPAVDTTESPEAKPAVKRSKKDKRNVPSGHVHIKATFNNTIITVTDTKGNALSWSSAGSCGFRGSKKGTAYAAQIASEKALNQAVNQYGLKKVTVFVGGIGLGREAAVRAVAGTNLMVEKIKDVTTTQHGGVRPPKQRRA